MLLVLLLLLLPLLLLLLLYLAALSLTTWQTPNRRVQYHRPSVFKTPTTSIMDALVTVMRSSAGVLPG